MAMAQGPLNKRTHVQNEYDRIYAFYNELERQESTGRLMFMIMGVTLVVATMIYAWIYFHPMPWQSLLKPFELVSG